MITGFRAQPDNQDRSRIMNRFDKSLRWAWSILVVSALAFGGCSGDDGKDGNAGTTGTAGPPGAAGPPGPPGPVPDAIQAAVDSAQVESCSTCHDGVGGGHQAIYDAYEDDSKLALTMAQADVSSADNGDGTATIGVTFQITRDGVPYVDAAGLGTLEQKRFIFMQYFSATGTYGPRYCYLSGFDPTATPGEYTAGGSDCQFTAPLTDWHVYGYIADAELFAHDSPTSEGAGSHVHLYDDVASVAVAIGAADAADAASYETKANVEGCETCHGSPYMKHGYREAQVANLPDFGACKSCHFDTRSGGHEDWQYMVDDPSNWATDALDAATVEAKYAYTANLKNDVHMSHAMEFPYPQSMANCATCHGAVDDGAGGVIPGTDKLDLVLADENFTAETCMSCHAMQGIDAWPKTYDPAGDEILDDGDSVPGPYYQSHRPPPMAYLWKNAGVDTFTFHAPEEDCNACHKEAAPGFASTFAELHTGYDARISDSSGVRYADAYTVSIDDISLAGNLLTVEFSSSDPTINPYLFVSFYGWDTKDFIVPSHWRDANRARFEYLPESSGGSANPLFTEDVASVPGAWIATADFSAFAAVRTDDIPTLIANGDVTKIEVSIAPQLDVNGVAVGLDGATQTFDLGTSATVADYFQGNGAIVDNNKCNVCHDQLSVTFHSGRGRNGEITMCRNCHASTNPGSHLEMQSRSIEGYVHAIHSFQDFDPGDTFEVFDAVLAKRYDQHIKHTFPNFTIRNCEACHNPGTYDVPDQSKSMPGALSASDTVATWYDIVDSTGFVGDTAVERPAGRNIGAVPEYVVGPASKACGGCHRADMISGDNIGEIASFNAHTDAFGTLVKNDTADDEGTPDDDEVLFGIIDKIMTWFE